MRSTGGRGRVVPGNLNPGVDELGAEPVCRASVQSVLNCEV